MTLEMLESRLAIVEAELAQIKQQMQTAKAQQAEPRWKQIIGVFKSALWT